MAQDNRSSDLEARIVAQVAMLLLAILLLVFLIVLSRDLWAGTQVPVLW